MLPRPAQRPGPPIWIGGNSRAAMRRVAELADGWAPFEQPAAMAKVTATPVLVFEQLVGKIADLKQARAERGRSADVDVCYSPAMGRDAERNVEILTEGIPSYQEAGVTYVSIESHAHSFDDCIRELELYGKALRP